MTNLLRAGAAWLGQQLQAHAGTRVRLTQGATIAELTATLVVAEYAVVDEAGLPTTVTAAEWTFRAADLAAVDIAPDAETFVENLDDGGRYDVLPIAGRPAVAAADAAGVLLVVRTKRTE